jgi:hypothetical protein
MLPRWHASKSNTGGNTSISAQITTITKDSSYDHEAMNLKKMYQTTKTMTMKLGASDEMKWLNVMVSSGYKETMMDKYGPVMVFS